MKKILTVIALAVAASLMTGCAWLEASFEEFNRAWAGVTATMTTYNTDGIAMDKVTGAAFQIERDTKFDSRNSDGGSNKDSSVLSISLGEGIISHVGSSLILEEAGLDNVIEESGEYVTFENTSPGTPWLNQMRNEYRNLWEGTSKTIMIRSQHGTPIAVYTGSTVEIFPTDVPKSTWFRVDGKYLFVYRADFTVYENSLLDG